MKFAKVMFSQVSVCPQGVSASLHAGIQPPLGRHSSWVDNTPGQTHLLGRQPMGRHPSWADTSPPVQCMVGYGQQAGGTHPTGMHSCPRIMFTFFVNSKGKVALKF